MTVHHLPRGRRPQFALAVVPTATTLARFAVLALVWAIAWTAALGVLCPSGLQADQPILLAQADGPDAGAAEPPTIDLNAAEQMAREALAGPSAKQPQAEAAGQGAAAEPVPEKRTLNLFKLIFGGGWLMTATVLPILFMSLLVAVFAIERALALRRRKVLPPQLVKALGDASAGEGGLNPRQAYKICQQYPSAAASVIRSALLKVGRPHSELEHSVKDACEREAGRLYANVRPLSLAAAISPLLGLLGTVIGMIMAFFETASGNITGNKAAALAEGIYTALVTTFLGLVVAIPAAVLAHWFEGRIQALFREIDELLLGMLPQLERYEGKLRVQRRNSKAEGANGGPAARGSQPSGGTSASTEPAAHP